MIAGAGLKDGIVGLVQIFEARYSGVGDVAAPQRAPLSAVAGTTSHLKNAVGQKLFAASQRIAAAKAEQRTALKAAMTACMEHMVAEQQGAGADKRHALRLAHKAARARADATAAPIAQAVREYAVALREFKNT